MPPRIKIPRSVRKDIRQRAKIESGSHSSSVSDVEKSKEKAENKLRRRYAPLGQITGKLLGTGKYNLVKLREGNKLTAPTKSEIPPYKPNLLYQGYRHRTFDSNGEQKDKRFDVSAGSSDEMESKVEEKRKELGVEKVGSKEYVRDEGSAVFKYNEEKKSDQREDSKRARYVNGNRTAQSKTHIKALKKENKGKRNRENYVGRKNRYKTDYRFDEQFKKDKDERLKMLGVK